MKIPVSFLVFSALVVLYEPLSARQVGKFCYKDDIKNLKGDTTIVVSDTISPNAVVLNAATKDNNGNGFIDAINITFDNDTSVVSAITTGFSVKFGNVVLPVTGVEGTPGGTVRQWRLLIGEPTGAALATAVLQTSWTPTLTLTDLDRINSGKVSCIDSCPPVIYRAIKTISDAKDRSKDSVWVFLSEKIEGPNGATFAITNQPPSTFAVWWGNTTVSADSLLSGISNFTCIVNDSILYFKMSNRQDLTGQNWMNIETSSIVIRDKLGNTPASNNRKVRVEVRVFTIPDSSTDETSHCGCGSGILLAFLPPLYFKVRSGWGRRKKRAKK